MTTALNAVREFAPFDLVFADAAGGKLDGLDVTIDGARPGGVLIVDDMDLARHADDGLSEPLGAVREQILGDRRWSPPSSTSRAV